MKIEAPQEDILRYLEKKTIHRDNPYTSPVLREAVEDSYKRLIAPAIEREIRSELTESAEDGAIRVFGKNLEQLLMQPPIADVRCLAGIRPFGRAASWRWWIRQARLSALR